MSSLEKPFRTLGTIPIRWKDKNGRLHAVEGADVHHGVRLLWTICEIDLPGGEGFFSFEKPDCPACNAILEAETKK